MRQGLTAAGVSVPVIYMTGNEDPAVRKAAMATGCFAFLIKPFSAQELIELLKKSNGGACIGCQRHRHNDGKATDSERHATRARHHDGCPLLREKNSTTD